MESTSDLVKERLAKIERLRGRGVPCYATGFRPADRAADLHAHYEEGKAASVAGRIMAVRSHGKSAFLDVWDQSGRIQVYLKCDENSEAFALLEDLDIGDIVGVEGSLFTSKSGEISLRLKRLVLLAKGIRPLPEKWHGLKDIETRYRQRYVDLIANREVAEVFAKRSRIVRLVRDFLHERGFLEVETPMMQPMAGGARAKPFVTFHHALETDLYLRVAPELYLKRLLVGGFERVFEINRNFRNEGLSTRHNPEFTMLELYQAYGDLADMMEITESLVSSLAKEIFGGTELVYGSHKLSFRRPWRRLAFYDALREKTGADWRSLDLREAVGRFKLEMDPAAETADILNQAFAQFVEPDLVQPTLVVDYPVLTTPLARRKDADPELVDRFELYVANLEVANAFTELNDPMDQRKRLESQRDALGEDKRLDEDFLLALEYGMPPAGGLGIGIDRLVMLLTNQASIRDVVLFPTLRPERAKES